MGLEGIRSFYAGGGGGSSSGQLPKYADFASLPASASDGDVAVVLDTNTIYMYDSGSMTWVAVTAPGAPISVSDTDSIDLTLLANDISADLKISTDTADANYQLVDLNIQTAPDDPGLRAQIADSAIRGLLSASTPLGYSATNGNFEISQAGSAQDGYLSSTDWNTFNNKQDAITVADTNSVDLTLGVTLTADVRISSNSADAGNQLVSLNIESTGVLGLRAQVTDLAIRSTLSATTPITYDNTTGLFSVSDNAIDLAKIQQIATLSFLGRDTAGNGNVEVLSVAEAQAMLGISNTNTGDVTLAAVGSAPNGNAATLTGQQLNLEPADANNPGVVTGSTQIFGGDKIFNANIQANSSLLFRDATTNILTLNVPSAVTSHTLTLPSAQGATDTYLMNNGAGGLTWSTVSASGGATTIGAGVRTAAGQNVANVTFVTIVFGTEDFDVGGNYNTSTGVFTVPSDGKYMVQANLLSLSGGGWASPEVWQARICRASSGTTTIPFIGSNFSQATHTASMNSFVFGVLDCVAGDLLSILCYQESGATLALTSNNAQNWASFIRLGT